MDPFQLTGRTDSHVTSADGDPARMHPDALSAFRRMRRAAAADGIRMAIVSAFRDFDRQRSIWNRKWKGERPLHDRAGQPVDPATLSPHERLHAILAWSALPGASRHHWGTDLDVIDEAALSDGYAVRLVPGEYSPGGPFHRLRIWLEKRAAEFGYFFPYRTERNGVAPEPWHLSYAPVAAGALKKLTPDLLGAILRNTEIEGRSLLLADLPGIHRRYILGIDPPPVDVNESRQEEKRF